MVKVNALTTQTTIADDDLLFVNDHGQSTTGNETGESRNITVATLRRYLRGEQQVTIGPYTVAYIRPTVGYKPTEAWPQKAQGVWDFTLWDSGRFTWLVKTGMDVSSITTGNDTNTMLASLDHGTSPSRDRFSFAFSITIPSIFIDEGDVFDANATANTLNIAAGDADLIDNLYTTTTRGDHPKLVLMNQTAGAMDVWVCYY